MQDDSQATFTKMLTKQDGYIDLNNIPTKDKLDRMIRAYAFWPGVWTKFDINGNGVEKIIKIFPDEIIQVEGKKTMKFKDFINGYKNGSEFLEKLGLS